MPLDALNLTEPLVAAIVTLLQTNLNATIDQFNTSLTDSYPVPHAAQILPFVPVPSTLQGGTPAIGVQRLGGEFFNDQQYGLDALHRYAIVAICTHADHLTLIHQLERMLECVAYTIQQDRIAGAPTGTQSVLKALGGAWSVNFVDYSPGPMLGDLDPTDAEAPPRSYLSWTALTLESARTEV